MTEHLLKINSFLEQLNDQTRLVLNEISTIETYQKGEYLLRQDEVARFSFWIEKGCVRKFYLNQGKEITTEFVFSNDIAVSFESYTLQKPAYEYIQAISDTTVSRTSFTAFEQAKKNYPELIELDLLLTEYYALWLEKRLFEFHTLDATERYMLLLNKDPHIIQNASLTHIASYLGISLETLSRIRARI